MRMLIFDEARSDVAEAAAKSCHDINVYVSMNSTEHCPQVLSFNGLIDDNREATSLPWQRMRFALSCLRPEPQERARGHADAEQPG